MDTKADAKVLIVTPSAKWAVSIKCELRLWAERKGIALRVDTIYNYDDLFDDAGHARLEVLHTLTGSTTKMNQEPHAVVSSNHLIQYDAVVRRDVAKRIPLAYYSHHGPRVKMVAFQAIEPPPEGGAHKVAREVIKLLAKQLGIRP